MTLCASTDEGWQNELSKSDQFIDTVSLEALAVISFAGLFEEAMWAVECASAPTGRQVQPFRFLERTTPATTPLVIESFAHCLGTSPKFIRTSLLRECHRKAPVAFVKAADCTNQIQHRRKQTTLPSSVSL